MRAFCILIGYFLGSINPAYFLGRALKGIDIREHGTGNAGTRNVHGVLGLWPAVVTAIFDLAKGLAAMAIAWRLGAPEIIIYAAGYAAVLGHVFPFYLGFRGGEGAATSVAILFFLIGKSVPLGWIPYEMFIPLAVFALVLFGVTRTPELVGAFTLPLLITLLLLKAPINATIVFMAVILAHLWVLAVFNIRKLRLLKLGDKARYILTWRTLSRPAAVLFIIFPFFISRRALIYLTGSVAAFSILLDLVRLSSPRVNVFLFRRVRPLFKETETRRFSSMTLFFAAVFILILAFPMTIASYAIVFLIFGDLAAKFFGMIYGRTPLISKTLEGSSAYFVFSFAAGYVLQSFLWLPLWLIALGAFTAAVTEVFSIFGIDDNFTVGLVSGALMLAFNTLLK